MSEHTGGRWDFFADENGYFVTTDKRDPDGEQIEICFVSDQYPSDICDAAADARLIAAAPELLAFAKEQFNNTACTCKFERFVGGEPPCSRCRLGALIEKAEGK